MPIHVLDKAYRVATTNGVAANRVVVAGPLSGECSLPASENAPNLLGVTVHAQPEAGRMVTVRKVGIAEVAAAGAIPLGAPVIAADATGKVKAATGAAGTKVNVLGFAETAAIQNGDLIEVFLSIHQRTL
ncbi:MAG: capsid cement protein [Candidatus Sumerlaeaceae bacterium]|jgi:hypothetical protein